LSRNSLTMPGANFRPTPSARAKVALSWAKIATFNESGGTTDNIARANFGTDALHRRQQPEPVSLGGIDEAVKVDVVFADMRLDHEARRRADGRQLSERPVEQKAR